LTAGRVTSVAFKPGQNVETNAVLIRLDDEIQRADLKEAEARLEEARSAMQRATSLNLNSAVSAATVESQAATVATAEADRDRAVRRFTDRTVRAPFSGVVGFARIELGSRVKEGDVITTLDDLSAVEIEFTVPEAVYGRLQIGQRIEATASAFQQRKFSGDTDSIDSRIDPVARAVTARAVIENPDRLLPAGMFMHVSVVLDPRRALSVPETAVQVAASEHFVFVLNSSDKGESVSRRKVEVGQRGFGHVEILSGLEVGEEVVIRGIHRLRDGAAVKTPGGKGGKKPLDQSKPGGQEE
jgi:membrane fusion protein (multidrug efflux system)